MKLLIIEDEKDLSESICAFFSNEHFVCETAYNYQSAVDKINRYDYAVIILDLSLPDGNGLEILKEIKANEKTEGVIIISARNSLEDKLKGLKIGADDYLTKPFHLPELGARVSAIIRRVSFAGRNVIHFDELALDLDSKTLRSTNGYVDLTHKEYDLLLYLLSNKNRVVTKEAIVEHLWGDEIEMADSYDFVYTHIKNLRRKLVLSGNPDNIKSVYGMGYKFLTPAT